MANGEKERKSKQTPQRFLKYGTLDCIWRGLLAIPTEELKLAEGLNDHIVSRLGRRRESPRQPHHRLG